MKTLIAIWATVLITALGTGAYKVAEYVKPPYNPDLPNCIIVDIDGTVNAAINERVAQSMAEQLQPAATVQQIQPAGTIEIKTYNPQQTINGKELQGN